MSLASGGGRPIPPAPDKPARPRSRRPPPGRRGASLAMALVALVLIVMVLGSMLKRARDARRVTQAEERQIQADWLAESGLDRAAARLAGDAGYTGEIWSISADELGGQDPAVVNIRVDPTPAGPGLRRVQVQADFPTDAPRRARRSKTANIAVGAERRDGGS